MQAADAIDDPLDLEIELGEDVLDLLEEPVDVVALVGLLRHHR